MRDYPVRDATGAPVGWVRPQRGRWVTITPSGKRHNVFKSRRDACIALIVAFGCGN